MAVAVLAVGNPSRGDDALGPLLLEQLEALALPGVKLVGDFQFQPEHALDLAEQDLALFIDAGTNTHRPFVFRELAPASGRGVSSHAFAPEEVLQVFETIHLQPPPPAFLLCVRGEEFGLGHGLSSAAQTHFQLAMEHLRRCLEAPSADAWRHSLVEDQGVCTLPQRRS